MKPGTRLNRFVKNMRREDRRNKYCITTEKRKFPAEEDARGFMDRNGIWGRAYFCGSCMQWHFTTNPDFYPSSASRGRERSKRKNWR